MRRFHDQRIFTSRFTKKRGQVVTQFFGNGNPVLRGEKVMQINVVERGVLDVRSPESGLIANLVRKGQDVFRGDILFQIKPK